VALALRHVRDPDVFLSELRGGLPLTQEYLLREVLAAQPTETRDRMLKASILDRFCPEVLDAVFGPGNPSGPGGRELVDRLQGHHLFTISLDARGEWYRYHHLFRDLLRGLLRESAGAEEIAALHSRASEWFESRGLIGESIGYALAAGDVVRAAELVERHRHAELDADRWYVVGSWLARLPAEIKEQRPGLLLARAWANFFQLRLDRMASLLEQVEPLLDEETTEPGLSGEVHYFRGYLSYWEGEGEDGRDHFEQALERLPEGQQLIPGEAALHLGLARCMTGQKEKAVQELSDRIRSTDPTRAVFLSRLIGGLILIDLLSGDLPRARVDARQLQDVATRNGLHNTEGWAWYLGACPHLHTHDLAPAAQHFAQAAELRYVLESRAVVDSLAGMALTRQLLGQPDDAERAAGRLEEFARELDDAEGLSVARSCRARLALLRGERDAAVRWARSFDDAPAPASLFLWVEVPVLTRARALVAEGSHGSLGEATELLGAIRRQGEACRYTGQTIEAAVLQSLALEKQGRTDAAMRALDEAVGLAGPGGWIRPFVEAGPQMAGMLGRRAAVAADEGFVDRVRAAFAGRVAAAPAGGSLAATPAPVAPLPAPEGLTNRELDILELLAQRLQDKEIAERLVIAPPTVNYHLKRLYRKLGVHGRRQAVDHARRAGLLLRGRSSS
jgi:LuxR family maltose regulon positive regulatory protein